MSRVIAIIREKVSSFYWKSELILLLLLLNGLQIIIYSTVLKLKILTLGVALDDLYIRLKILIEVFSELESKVSSDCH